MAKRRTRKKKDSPAAHKPGEKPYTLSAGSNEHKIFAINKRQAIENFLKEHPETLIDGITSGH